MVTTWWETDKGRSLIFLSLGLLLGGSWNLGTIGIAFSPLLALLVSMCRSPTSRWLAALGYHLGGAIALPSSAAVFFGPGHLLLGILLWFASSVLLSLPWSWASNGWRTLLAILTSAIPPLGIIGWLSPLTAAGLWFPGTRWVGLILLTVLLWSIAQKKILQVFVLYATATIANAVYVPPHPPHGWIGVTTHVGPVTNRPAEQYARLNLWIAQVRKQAQGTRVVVLPETLTSDMWAGTRFVIGEVIPPDQTWLIGASVEDSQGLWDSVIVGHHHNVDRKVLFRAVLPVPVSMWKPTGTDGYTAAWWVSRERIADENVMAIICYDQLLVWPWLETLLENPSILIAPSNLWWARDENIQTIQTSSVLAWSRLMGKPVVTSSNL